MLVRVAITGGLLLTTGIASGQVPAVRTGPVQLTDFGVPEVQEAAQVPTCPWDCQATPDQEVGISDFLEVLAQWTLVDTSCDFDGGGVGINDFLLLLANWGLCPGPVNDECDGKIIIDRLDSGGTLMQPFDLTGATPSADATLCAAAAVQDIWYCLRNTTQDEKDVTLSGKVDVLAEVTAGCDCANPGPLVACGSLEGPVPTFTMQPGDEVCVRLHNEPGGAFAGNLVITNEPTGPPSEKCFNQQPNQVNATASDVDCDLCAGGTQIVADQAVLLSAEMIDEIRFWGVYFPGDAGGGDPLPDNFTVKFRLNDASTGVDVPGSVVRKLKVGPATTRTATGVILFGVREFEYTIDLDPNQDLPAGFYWVEIYNDTTNDPTDDDWFWETGALDHVNGLPGSVVSTDVPNVPPKVWSLDRISDLSLNMTCKPMPPTN